MAGYLGIFVAAIAAMVIGALWYSPMLFGNAWMKMQGWSKKDMEKKKKDTNMGMSYGLMFVGSLVAAWVMSMLVDFAGASTFLSGAVIGVWVWLGFGATLSLGSVLWEGKPWNLWMLNNGHTLVSWAVIGGIVAMM